MYLLRIFVLFTIPELPILVRKILNCQQSQTILIVYENNTINVAQQLFEAFSSQQKYNRPFISINRSLRPKRTSRHNRNRITRAFFIYLFSPGDINEKFLSISIGYNFVSRLEKHLILITDRNANKQEGMQNMAQLWRNNVAIVFVDDPNKVFYVKNPFRDFTFLTINYDNATEHCDRIFNQIFVNNKKTMQGIRFEAILAFSPPRVLNVQKMINNNVVAGPCVSGPEANMAHLLAHYLNATVDVVMLNNSKFQIDEQLIALKYFAIASKVYKLFSWMGFNYTLQR